MPGHNAYGATLFARASAETIIRGKNNINNLNVDDETQRQLEHRGICSGITSGWLTMFLNDMVEARDGGRFDAIFDVVRFQGAYLKELHGRAPEHIDALRQMTDPRLKTLNTDSQRTVSKIGYPKSGPWAAYVSAWGHAVAIGFRSGTYYFMDPNYGLFQYDNVGKFHADLQDFVEARATRKNKDGSAKITCYFYGPS